MYHRSELDGRYFLAEEPNASGLATEWVSSLVHLGIAASRYRSTSDRRLVVTLSVPQRDLVAALVATGHSMAKNALNYPSPSEVLRDLQSGTPVRFVTNEKIHTATFYKLIENRTNLLAHIGASKWQVDMIRALSVLDSDDVIDREMSRPTPGGLIDFSELRYSWDIHLASPVQDLAIIGPKSRTERDLDMFIGRAEAPEPPSTLRSLVLPYSDTAPTWFSSLLSAQEAEDKLPMSPEYSTAILDGNAAIQLLVGVQTDVVFCILDRSIKDEGAADIVIQQRARNQPISLRDLSWEPPVGVEALAFTGAKWNT